MTATGPTGPGPGTGVTGTGSSSATSGTSSDDRSVGDILGAITSDLTTLVKQELELAKTEAKAEATRAGKGAGFLGGAGVTAHLALLFGSLALMLMLDSWMHTGWAALIVTALWGAVAAVLALRGRSELQRLDPTLEKTQTTLKEDARWAKHPTRTS